MSEPVFQRNNFLPLLYGRCLDYLCRYEYLPLDYLFTMRLVNFDDLRELGAFVRQSPLPPPTERRIYRRGEKRRRLLHAIDQPTWSLNLLQMVNATAASSSS